MGRLDEFKGAAKFDAKSLDGFGDYEVRHLKAGEFLDIMSDKDARRRIVRLTVAAIYDGDAPLFSSNDEAEEIESWLFDALSDDAVAANKSTRKDAEKNSQTPPISK